MLFVFAILNKVLIDLVKSCDKEKVILPVCLFFSNKVQESFKIDTLSLQMSSHCVHTSIYMYDERRIWEFFDHFLKG